MSGYVVFADFVEPGTGEAFRGLADAHARQSAEAEPGCRRFDVIEPEGVAGKILPFEIYDDRAAFDAHIRSGHYARFEAASGGLVVSKRGV